MSASCFHSLVQPGARASSLTRPIPRQKLRQDSQQTRRKMRRNDMSDTRYTGKERALKRYLRLVVESANHAPTDRRPVLYLVWRALVFRLLMAE